jgi:hypothetical protein
VRSKRRSYYVINDKGRYLRNRKFLKKRAVDSKGVTITSKVVDKAAEAADSDHTPAGPRRSDRLRNAVKKKVRFSEQQ